MNEFTNQIDFWKKSSEDDWETAKYLFAGKRYNHSLFFCHLTLEKILKALVVENTNSPAPYLHDLERLVLLAKLSLSEKQLANLRTITGFNISTRYDSIKFSFFKSCTKEYAENYLNITDKLLSWLKKQSLKKQGKK